MKCQRCGFNDANVSYTQIINGEKIKLYLCDECAEELNIGMNFNFDFNNLFGTFFDEPSFVKTIEKPKELDTYLTRQKDQEELLFISFENFFKSF